MQLQKLARGLKFRIQKLEILYYLGSAQQSADQTARMRRLICAFAVCIWQKQVLSCCSSLFEASASSIHCVSQQWMLWSVQACLSLHCSPMQYAPFFTWAGSHESFQCFKHKQRKMKIHSHDFWVLINLSHQYTFANNTSLLNLLIILLMKS